MGRDIALQQLVAVDGVGSDRGFFSWAPICEELKEETKRPIKVFICIMLDTVFDKPVLCILDAQHVPVEGDLLDFLRSKSTAQGHCLAFKLQPL